MPESQLVIGSRGSEIIRLSDVGLDTLNPKPKTLNP